MTKKRAKRGFIIFSIVLAIGLFLSFCPFYISFNYSTFNGFFNAIPLGTDITGGTYSVYDCELNTLNGATDFDTEIDKTISNLQKSLSSMGYINTTVSKENSNQIRIENGILKDLQDMTSILGTYSSIMISSKGSSDFDVANPSGNYLTSKNITQITDSYAGGGTFGIIISFDSEGQEILTSIIDEAETGSSNSKTGYLYLLDNDGECESPMQIPLTDGAKNISFSSTSFSSQNSADLYVLQLMSATYGVKLEISESAKISAVLGDGTLLCLSIASFVALAIMILVLTYRYGHFGLLAGLGTLSFLVLDLFLIQTIPSIVINIGSYFALLFTYFLLTDAFIIVFEKIREEYALGKKLPLSVRGGFKKATWHIVDMNLITCVFGVVLCFFSITLFKSIGFILIVGSLLSMFVSLVLMPLLCGWYVNINSTKVKYLNLKRDKNINNEVIIENPDEKGGNE